MTPEEEAIGWIEAISAFFTAVAVFFGFISWCIDLKWRAAIDNVGLTALDENRMGYFVVSWYAGKRTSPPVLPTISTIIKAGDMFVYTSSMFDWLPSSHEELSWKNLYEAFFKELSWRAVLEKEKRRKDQRKAYQPSIRQALCNSDKDVLQLKNARSEEQRLKTLERHLLYPGFSKVVSQRDPEAGGRARGPYLQNCTRTLRPKTPWKSPENFDPILGHDKSWQQDLQQIWIREGKPCLEVSSEELAALAFVLGMPLRLDNAARMEKGHTHKKEDTDQGEQHDIKGKGYDKQAEEHNDE
jgi:hypothetical protein